MKNLVILGAGSAGTIMANHLNKSLPRSEWAITIVDQYESHYYQPGFLFIPFGTYTEKDVVKSKRDFIPKGVKFVLSKIEKIVPEANQVQLADDQVLSYDILIVATGAKIERTPIQGDTTQWDRDVFDFYTLEGDRKSVV